MGGNRIIKEVSKQAHVFPFEGQKNCTEKSCYHPGRNSRKTRELKMVAKGRGGGSKSLKQKERGLGLS